MRHLARSIAIYLTCLTALAAAGLEQAGATGFARIQQQDGSVRTYPNVSIRYSKQSRSLTITTADRKGTLIVDQAACSYIDRLYRCLLTRASLKQNGETNPLDFETGTLYANTTQNKMNLPLSSQAIMPNSIVMALKTTIGTYVTVTGTIDEGAP